MSSRSASILSAAQRRRAEILLTGEGPRPDATPSDGPDPYGNPDPAPAWMRIDWREHRREVRIGSDRVNFVDVGSGDAPPIVFVHGLGGSWQNFLENVPHFAEHRRVVALDLPGFGASEMPEWEITIPRYGDFLRGFAAEIDLAPCVLVGNSMGGLIACEAAIDDPSLLDRLALISAVGISNVRLRREPAEAAARLAAAMAPLAFQFREASMRRPALRNAAFRQIFRHPEKLRPELLWEQYRGALGRDGGLTASAFVPSVAALAGYDYRERLRAIRAPSLIVWGRSDLVVPPQDAAEYARLIAGARVEVFESCGHLPQLERPVRFNRLLDGFLLAE